MPQVLAEQEIDSTAKSALVTGISTRDSTYAGSRISNLELAIVIQINEEVIVTPLSKLKDKQLSDVIITHQDESVVCDSCGEETFRYQEVNSFSEGLLGTIKNIDDDTDLTVVGNNTEKYHCHSCYNTITDMLVESIHTGEISNQLTIRNL